MASTLIFGDALKWGANEKGELREIELYCYPDILRCVC